MRALLRSVVAVAAGLCTILLLGNAADPPLVGVLIDLLPPATVVRHMEVFASRAQHADSTQRQRPFTQYHQADSIRLERLPGYWGGPSYQIVVDRSERLLVRPDSIARSLFRIPAPKPGTFHDLMAYALISRFAELPDTLQSHPVFGRVCGTDASTAIVTLYHQQLVKRVVDYEGCEWAPASIRELERAIDEAAGRRPSK